jgi:hypothetical protein
MIAQIPQTPARLTAIVFGVFLFMGSANNSYSNEIIGFKTGNDLYSSCTKKNDFPSECSVYLMAIADTMAYAMADGQSVFGLTGCVPAGVTLGQIRDITVQYLYKHSAIRQSIASVLVAAAISEAFPCPK